METPPKPHISTIFATPVVAIDWPESNDLNTRLREVILTREATSDGVKRSNVGGWHSENDLLTWPEPAIGEFRDMLQAMAQDILNLSLQEADITAPYNASYVAWANVLRDRGYHSVHDHPMAHWSGVYYVATGSPNGNAEMNGRLELLDPRTGVNMVAIANSVFATRCLLETRAGRMIFFPSWLKHVVHPFRGTGQRISISFNLTLSQAPT